MANTAQEQSNCRGSVASATTRLVNALQELADARANIDTKRTEAESAAEAHRAAHQRYRQAVEEVKKAREYATAAITRIDQVL